MQQKKAYLCDLKNTPFINIGSSTMQQTQTIRIFLGSSIVELHDERVILGDYIMNSVHPIFKNDGIEIELFKCEDIHSGNTGELQQDKIDELLRNSDVSVFMFKNKAGRQTVREFGVARETQKTKRHEMYVYCFDVPKAGKGEDLNNFQNRLIEEEFYWNTCKDVADLESQFILGLLKYERQLLGMKPSMDIEQESITEKDGDALFEKYEQNEQAHEQTQAPLRKEIHQCIDDLLQQIETVMENEDDTIAAKIIKVIELYKKADQWAEATAYDKEKYSDLLYNYAKFLNDYGLYKEAESVYLRQIRLVEELYGSDYEDTAISYNNIGMVYGKQGNYNKALVYFFKALGIYEQIYGKEHSAATTTYNNIGVVYYKLGDYDKAIEYYFKALAIKEKVLGTEHPDTATSYNNIGLLYHEQGNYVKALEYYLKVLIIFEKALGMGHPSTATTYNNIAAVYLKQGNFDKALEYHQKALEIKEKVLGTEHPDIASSYNNIGAVYEDKGDYGKALEYHQKALEIKEKILGTVHPDTALSYWNIGAVYYQQNDYKKALECLDKAYLIYEKTLGLNHPYTKNLLGWIAGVKQALTSNGKTK